MAAVIFDMDGVLVDGEPLHYAAAQQVLAEHGATLDEETYRRFIGMTLDSFWEDLQARIGVRLDRDAYTRRYDAVVLERYRADTRVMPGARGLLARLRAARIPCALASSSKRAWVTAALEAAGLRGYFRVTIAGDEVARGKPDPEVYLAAARGLGVAPTACVVVEDAPAGITAARRAGMRVVAVRTAMTAGLSLDGADPIIDSLAEFDMALLHESAGTPGGDALAGARGPERRSERSAADGAPR